MVFYEKNNLQTTWRCCDKEFLADTFEEIVELSKQHGMEMFQKNDPDHLEAIGKIQELMLSPDAM